MTIHSEEIYQKAKKILHRCGTRDSLQVAQDLGIYLHFIDGFKDLLGMYTYQQKERHILLNANMDDILMQMVCAHEIGHDALHREQAKEKAFCRSLFFLTCAPRWSMRQTHLLLIC